MAVTIVLAMPAFAEHYTLILRGGNVYDGNGGSPITADVGVIGDRVAAIGDLSDDSADEDWDVRGLAVAPGFINMLSWAADSLIRDGRGLSDIKQGVTLEVFGEGWTLGPVNEDRLKTDAAYRLRIGAREGKWSTLGEAMAYMENKGVSPNIASFVGATSIRAHQLGFEDRAPTTAELATMQSLVREAMEEGAMGVGSSLIYPPASFSTTDELVALSEVAAEYDGMYISHIRDEGAGLLGALNELIAIARRAPIRAEVYHLKALGEANWHKLDDAIQMIERARSEGLSIAANIYTYSASGTGLTVCLPTWVEEGGHGAMVRRLKDPDTRSRILDEIRGAGEGIHNPFRSIGAADRILLVGFKNPALVPLSGKSLSEVARARGKSPEEVVMDLIVEDDSRVGAIYFLMSEENVRKKAALPWVSFGSDAPAPSHEASDMRSGHPRAYGNFARFLGKYVRDEGVVSLAEAIRKMTALPAERLRIQDRGLIRVGYYADLAVFDPDRVRDTATYEHPNRYAEGMVHVLVNGAPVLHNGRHTGAMPGRFVRGPGWKGNAH